jgi:hypothetical protein
VASPALTSAYDAPAESSASHGDSSVGVAAVTRVLSAGVMPKRASHVATRRSASDIVATSGGARTKTLPDVDSVAYGKAPLSQTTLPRELTTGDANANARRATPVERGAAPACSGVADEGRGDALRLGEGAEPLDDAMDRRDAVVAPRRAT